MVQPTSRSPKPKSSQAVVEQNLTSCEQEILKVVHEFFTLHDSSEIVGSINEMIQDWVGSAYKDYARNLEDPDMKMWDGHLRNVLETVTLIAELNDIDRFKDYYELMAENRKTP